MFVAFLWRSSLETSSFDKTTELSKRDVTIAALSERADYLHQQLSLQTSVAESVKADKQQLEAALRELRPKYAALEDSCEKLNQQMRHRDEKISKMMVCVLRL